MMRICISVALVFLVSGFAYAINVSEALIDNQIGQFLKSYPGACSEGSGVIAGAGHFELDHMDQMCDIRYYKRDIRLGAEVQVTKHTGGESDKWLLHEVERGFRDSDSLESRVAEEALIREISGNKIFYYGGGVVGYRWLSSNTVINIQYTNLSGPKPEPLEIVSAYLALHPSTITFTDAEIKSSAHNELWIKDEMDRRLWLGGKWIGKITNVGEDRKKKLIRVVNHLNIFLDYRNKYYGVASESEKASLDVKLQAEDKDAIEAKLNEYYQWWTQNKTGAINLP